MTIALFFERLSINWLKDRMGCDWQFFQKSVELKIRYKQIQDKELNRNLWGLVNDAGQYEPPKYNPDRYRNYYYYYDVEDVMEMYENKPREDKD
jgi:hypothetical protein